MGARRPPFATTRGARIGLAALTPLTQSQRAAVAVLRGTSSAPRRHSVRAPVALCVRGIGCGQGVLPQPAHRQHARATRIARAQC